MKAWNLAAAAGCLLLLVPPARAGELYFDRPLEELSFVEGELPAADSMRWRPWQHRVARQPYAVLDGPGEAYLASSDLLLRQGQWMEAPSLSLSVQVPDDVHTVSGRLFVPEPADSDEEPAFRVLRFVLSPEDAEAGAEERFWRSKADHYSLLLAREVPGAAWFRRQRDAAAARLASLAGSEPREPGPDVRLPGDIEDSYDLFTGGRALAENLQLDRELAPGEDGKATIPIEELGGITVKEFDWTGHVEGLEPELDPLAALLPEDQHALFFPGVPALLAVVDEAARNGTPFLQAFEPRAEDARTRERYETQLCLPLDTWARTLGPLVVEEVAITGSDPYLRTGSDVAVLMRARDAGAVEAFLAARREGAPGAEERAGEAGGVAWRGAVSPDRAVCSYAAAIGEVVIVTNSLAQLERIAAVSAGELPALASSPEYVFFRDRYARGEGGESAFLMLTDATIRRWCSPRWRVGAARRTRAAAFAAAEQAAHVAGLASGEAAGSGDPGALQRLLFQPPIAETEIPLVTAGERDAYRRFRDRYQSNWRAFFDPIAARITVADDGLGLDVSVWPLIEVSDYRSTFLFSWGASFAPDAGDPHAGALAHLVMGLNHESGLFRSSGGWASAVGGDFAADPLGWVGDHFALFTDADPFWEEWAEAAARGEGGRFVEDELRRLPLVVHVGVSDPLRLAAFLTALRAFSGQAAPNMLVWENRTHGELAYVRIAPASEGMGLPEGLALYYAPLPDALILTLREDALLRVLDRRASGAEEGGEPPSPWLGASAALRMDRGGIELALGLGREELVERGRQLAWGNIPILNEWRRLFPDADPVALHEELWGVRLRCPGGGEYAWSEAWQTYGSSVYGHPAEPAGEPGSFLPIQDVRSVSFGLTSEEDGLRARTRLEREP